MVSVDPINEYAEIENPVNPAIKSEPAGQSVCVSEMVEQDVIEPVVKDELDNQPAPEIEHDVLEPVVKIELVDQPVPAIESLSPNPGIMLYGSGNPDVWMSRAESSPAELCVEQESSQVACVSSEVEATDHVIVVEGCAVTEPYARDVNECQDDPKDGAVCNLTSPGAEDDENCLDVSRNSADCNHTSPGTGIERNFSGEPD